MNTFKTILTACLVGTFGMTMAQTSETSEKKTSGKPPTTPAVTSQKKETKSQTGSTTGKTGTYQKAEKQPATGSKAKTTRKPKTKKERLEMEAAARSQTGTATRETTFKPGADGFVEVSKSDLEAMVDRMGDGKLKIKSFTLVYTQNGTTKKLLNNTREITPEVRKAVDAFAVGQTFTIEDAKGATRDGREMTLPITKFRIKQNAEVAPATPKQKK